MMLASFTYSVCIYLFSWSFLLISLPRSIAANNDISSLPVSVERHIVIQGCKDSGFWQNLMESLVSRIDFTSVSCIATEEEERFATETILQRKIDRPNNEIHLVASLLTSNHCVDSSKCRATNPGDNYIELLRAGVKGWFVENEPHFETLGVNRTEDNIQSTELFPDNADGGRQIGREFCRIAESLAPATIAVLYGNQEAAHSTARIENFIAGMEEFCPEARHQVKYSFYADWNADKAASMMAPVLLRDGSLNAVIAANDDMALGALVAAKEIRPDSQLLVAGYDANSYVKPLLNTGAMFATVDQSPPSGLVYSLEVMLSDKANGAADFGPASECSIRRGPTCDLQDYNVIQSSTWSDLAESLSDKVSTAVSIRVKEPSLLLLRERLVLYNPAIRPPPVGVQKINEEDSTTSPEEMAKKVIGLNSDQPPQPVLVQLKNFKVYELSAATQSTFGQGVLLLTWKDTRLAWSTTNFPEVEFIHLNIEDIWHPVVVLSNLLNTGSRPLSQIQTTIYPDGTVVWEQNINSGEFRCVEIDDTILNFPFDSHRCGIDITSYNNEEITLRPTVEIPDDAAFDVIVENNDWFQGDEFVTLEVSEESKFETAKFKVEMTRDPLFVELSFVIPSYLLNIISFAQFWIPTQSDHINLDRGGMAITTILAALALRETMTSEVGTSFTLLDLFMLTSLLFQFVGFIITAYESSYKRVKKRTGDGSIGFADRFGKLTLPVFFGMFNAVLAVLWAGTLWSLFYLSVVEVVGCIVVNHKDQKRVRKHLQQQMKKISLRNKLGLNVGRTGNNADDADPEAILRYWRWKTLAGNELRSRQDFEVENRFDIEDGGEEFRMGAEDTAGITEKTAISSCHTLAYGRMSTFPLEIEEAAEEATEHQAATALQRAFRKHRNKKVTNSEDTTIISC